MHKFADVDCRSTSTPPRRTPPTTSRPSLAAPRVILAPAPSPGHRARQHLYHRPSISRQPPSPRKHFAKHPSPSPAARQRLARRPTQHPTPRLPAAPTKHHAKHATAKNLLLTARRRQRPTPPLDTLATKHICTLLSHLRPAQTPPSHEAPRRPTALPKSGRASSQAPRQRPRPANHREGAEDYTHDAGQRCARTSNRGTSREECAQTIKEKTRTHGAGGDGARPGDQAWPVVARKRQGSVATQVAGKPPRR